MLIEKHNHTDPVDVHELLRIQFWYSCQCTVKLASSSRKFVTKEYSAKRTEMFHWYEKTSKNFADDAEELRVCSNL
jgi:hypothetical protein